VKISRGNFYFYFKTKDEILDAVINRRLAETRKMLDGWEIEGKTPADRIRSFIHILIANRADIKRFGCPVGTLCSELGKLNHPAQPEASELFTLFRTRLSFGRKSSRWMRGWTLARRPPRPITKASKAPISARYGRA